MDLTEAEDIKKWWQEYTEELYKKDLHDPDNHDGVTTHLELDILECEVKWALGSITMNKASVQFSSVAQSCPTLFDPMNRSTPGLPVHHQLPEFTQTHVHQVSECHPAISSSVIPFSSCPQSLPALESFPRSQLFA